MAQRNWNIEKSANNSGTFEVQYLESLLLQDSRRSLDVPTSLTNGWVYTLQKLVVCAQQYVPVKYFKIFYILFGFFFIFSLGETLLFPLWMLWSMLTVYIDQRGNIKLHEMKTDKKTTLIFLRKSTYSKWIIFLKMVNDF